MVRGSVVLAQCLQPWRGEGAVEMSALRTWDEMTDLCRLFSEGLLPSSGSIAFAFWSIFSRLAVNGNLCTEKILLTATALYFC